MLTARQKMWLGIRRVLTPKIIVSLIYYFKYGARVSPRAEVELNSNLVLGRDCRIGPFVKIKAFTGPLHIGARARIEAGCFITSREGGTMIGDDFVSGPDAKVICGNYRYDQKGVHLEDLGGSSKGIVIGDRVSIGAGAMIADGAKLGDDTQVLPGALVNRPFKGGIVLGGSPARRIKPEEDAD
ncbi:acyltransferase [Altererythrobacter lutimaris]|uniref:Acyltransferase n=1 Tax=Altererythrobacter lutimaris TaxID=2743979 RepID=A0A850H2J1_9SPHN|nr:DapH/DapD/GlmU-related protein [Altererythrobacter lutimaris]NVE93334.1 acyltransferase [Altererythrobacter lutimaris]